MDITQSQKFGLAARRTARKVPAHVYLLPLSLVLAIGLWYLIVFLADFPAYRGGLLAEFGWVLERIGSGVGIAINPGWEFGMDLDPATVEQLIHLNTLRSGAEPAAGD